MIWQVQQALPWSQIEDPILRAAFQYANSSSSLKGRKWSADESKQLYLSLRNNLIDSLKVSAL